MAKGLEKPIPVDGRKTEPVAENFKVNAQNLRKAF